MSNKRMNVELAGHNVTIKFENTSDFPSVQISIDDYHVVSIEANLVDDMQDASKNPSKQNNLNWKKGQLRLTAWKNATDDTYGEDPVVTMPFNTLRTNEELENLPETTIQVTKEQLKTHSDGQTIYFDGFGANAQSTNWYFEENDLLFPNDIAWTLLYLHDKNDTFLSVLDNFYMNKEDLLDGFTNDDMLRETAEMILKIKIRRNNEKVGT
jgi:hypothetical protein